MSDTATRVVVLAVRALERIRLAAGVTCAAYPGCAHVACQSSAHVKEVASDALRDIDRAIDALD